MERVQKIYLNRSTVTLIKFYLGGSKITGVKMYSSKRKKYSELLKGYLVTFLRVAGGCNIISPSSSCSMSASLSGRV